MQDNVSFLIRGAWAATGYSSHLVCLFYSPECHSAAFTAWMPSHKVLVVPWCACASKVYCNVFVCLSVCVDCYSCSTIMNL